MDRAVDLAPMTDFAMVVVCISRGDVPTRYASQRAGAIGALWTDRTLSRLVRGFEVIFENNAACSLAIECTSLIIDAHAVARL
jgi:hypothetical protein